MQTVRMRTKKRGVHQKGYKQDGKTESMDLCPCCLSFGCDPMSMSEAFKYKVYERLRKKCCPSCGEPKDFCHCRSAKGQPTRIVTRNNKKLRAARQLVIDKEMAMRYWNKQKELMSIFGEELYDDILDSLWNHEIPEIAWETVAAKLQQNKLNTEVLAPGWK